MKKFVAAAALVCCAGVAHAGPFDDLSLFTFGNYTSTSETEGRAVIGGNLGGPASNYAIGLNAGDYLGVDTLIVGGDINATNVNLNAGNARVGGASNGNVNLNGGGALTTGDASVAAQIAAMGSVFTSASTHLAGLTQTGSVSLPGSQPSSVQFTATPGVNGVSVINIAASDLFSNNNVQTINLDLAGADSVIINVSGSSVGFTTGGNFAGSFGNDNARSRVLWNFYEATDINLHGKAFEGALLAPNAHVAHQGVISGTVVADTMDSQSEIHLPGYKGYIPTPGSASLLALAGLTAARRRRCA